MSTKRTNAEKRTGSTDPRPTTVELGEDQRGADHIYRPRDELIHVIAADGTREHVEDMRGRSVDDWMAYVADRRGWEVKQYGAPVESLITALEGQI